MSVSYRKKLIEVALPLDEINEASAREKSIRHGHPSTLHLWWARRPLAACRAVLFASIIDDPDQPDVPQELLARIDRLPVPTKYRADWDHLTEAEQRRKKLFGFIEELVQWENSNNEDTLNAAHELILAATEGSPPPVLDPFCGGGSIPLEAQRLGLEAHGSDLNPVAVLITKALIEIPPKFADMPPVNPEARKGFGHTGSWRGATGLADDVRYYGKWMRDEAEKRIGHLYPKAKLPDGSEATVIAWIWARTVKCPNPACGCQMPLVRSFALSTKAGRQAWVEALIPGPSSPGPFSHAAGEGERRGDEGLKPGIRREATLEAQGEERDPALKLATPSPEIIQKARALRQTATTAEQLLWEFVRDRRLAGCKFRRQHPLGRFIADFFCAEARLVVELDGSVHQESDQQQRDQIREETLRANNLRVVRFSNERVMTQTSDVLNELSQALTPTPSPTPWERGQGVRVSFTVRTGAGQPREATVGKRGAVCLCCNTPVPLDHVRAEGKAKRMGAQLMAIVAEGVRGRIYLSPTPEHEAIAASAVPDWTPDTDLVPNSRHMTPTVYGMTTHASLFTQRQLVALSTFSDLVAEAQLKIKADIQLMAPIKRDEETAEAICRYSTDYAAALATYLAFAVSKSSDYYCTIATWANAGEFIRGTFARQAIPMTWDFVECNAFSSSTGNWLNAINWISDALLSIRPDGSGVATNEKADSSTKIAQGFLFSTDPPYYDNVPYADLSDFFYVWLRHSLSNIYPALFGTMLVPKAQELIADPFRHGGKEASRQFFEDGIKSVFINICQSAHTSYPVTVYYAFKQSEVDEDEDDTTTKTVSASTGWETMLQGLIEAGFHVTGTWPMRTERSGRMRDVGSNALASCIVLVCRPRPSTAQTATRREFLSLLRAELPAALRCLQQGNIAPVDFAQAAIGPGMAVFSRYKSVLEADGKPMRVRTALQLINTMLDEVVDPIDADSQTRWAVDWYRQFRFNEGEYGVAEVLATAKAVAISALEEAGTVLARGGKVKLLPRDELKADYDPASDAHITVWKITQYLSHALDEHGIDAAARLLRRYRDTRPEIDPERARELCFTLYTICERKGWAQDARPYNALGMSWSDIEIRSQEPGMENYSSPFIAQIDGEVREGLFK